MKILAFLDFYLDRKEWKKFEEDIRAAGYNVYYTRHDDEGNWVDPVSIKETPVLVNRCGWCIANFDLKFPENKLFPNEISVEEALKQTDKFINDEDVSTLKEIKVFMEGDEK